MNKIKWGLHGDYNMEEIEECILDHYPDLDGESVKTLASEIYNLTYDYILNIEFDDRGKITNM